MIWFVLSPVFPSSDFPTCQSHCLYCVIYKLHIVLLPPPPPLCTISILCLAWLIYGLRTVEQYSRFGRTSVKYAEALVSWLLIRRFRCKKPNMLLPFFTILSMWVFHERLTVRSTPRYFEWDSACGICPFSEQSCSTGDLDLVTLSTLHFSGWMHITQFSSQSARLLRSS